MSSGRPAIPPLLEMNEASTTNTVLPTTQQLENTVILVIGPTGAGKSTFINIATESDACTIGHRLSSCTNRIQPVRFTSPEGRSGSFVDTPGFDHTDMVDKEIWEIIVELLSAM